MSSDETAIPDEAVEAAAKALLAVLDLPAFLAEDTADRAWIRRDATAILAAAMPELERLWRDRIADEIHRRMPHIHFRHSPNDCPDCQWIHWAEQFVRRGVS